jgi:pimeloyl-ACP methyl ester carboxylesterase
MAAPLSSADELIQAVTDDGVRLALHRYKRRGESRRHPVICCHGLAANHLAFDVDPELSLARHLAERGFEVFLLELRGHGASQRPRWGWAFDDYVERDVPAAVRAVCERTASTGVHWIGHSMGGLLAFAYLSRGGSDDFRSAVTVGSSLDYSDGGTGFRRLSPLRPVLRRVPAVPVDVLARLSGRFVGRVTTPYERFNVWPSNTEPRHWRRICRRGFHPVSSPVMDQLASALEPGGLRGRDEERYTEGLGRVRTPVLALAGSRDAQCPPRAVERTMAKLSAKSRLAVFGPDHGHADHYGHFDLLVGRRARDEVFPLVESWLAEHD